MFNKKSFWRQKSPISNDKDLTALLQEWQGITPGANFEAEVWNRIHHASQSPLREWFTPPLVWGNALAAAAGLVLGIGLAFNMPSAHDKFQAETSLLQSHTLAGSYLVMADGGVR